MHPSRVLVALLVSLACLADAGAHADVYVPPPACPDRPPPDGSSCGGSPAGATCRYPRRGVVCECRRVIIDDAPRRQWTCGEFGE